MLINCPECQLMLSDKASVCPHCGYEARKSTRRVAKKPHRRLPNGFGQITEIKGRYLRKPFRAMVSIGKKPNGRPNSKILAYFETYNDAYAALVEYNRNPYDLDVAMTVQELYEKWSEQYFERIQTSSQRTITSAWAYCTSIYNMKVQDVRVRHIKGCMDTCDSPNIKSRIKSMFNLMLDYAVEYEIIDKNYARDFKTERPENITNHVAFTPEELQKLWNNTSIPLVNVVLIQCYTGWRPQELCKLKRKDVNIIERKMIGGMKTAAGIDREVPICNRILEPVKKIEYLSELLGSEWFVCDNDGSEMTYDKYNKRFHKLMSELDIEGHRPHDPRKTFITMCKEKGVDEYAIKRIVGHNIDDITEKIYTDRKFDWLLDEVKKIEDW